MAWSGVLILVGLATVLYLRWARRRWFPRIDAAHQEAFGQRSRLLHGSLSTVSIWTGYVCGIVLVVVGIIDLAT